MKTDANFRLTTQDWDDAEAAVLRLKAKHNAQVTERGLRFVAEGQHVKRHRREGAPL